MSKIFEKNIWFRRIFVCICSYLCILSFNKISSLHGDPYIYWGGKYFGYNMLSIILFSVNFGFVPTAFQLISVMVTFFIVYALALYGMVCLSKKLNVPLRHFSEWLYKLNSRRSRKVSEEK